MRSTTAAALLLLLPLAGCPSTTTPGVKPSGTASASATQAPSSAPSSAATTAAGTPAPAAPTPDTSAHAITAAVKVDGSEVTIKPSGSWSGAPGFNNTLFWTIGEGAGTTDDTYTKAGRMAAGEYGLQLQLRQQPESDFNHHFHDLAFDTLKNALAVTLFKQPGSGKVLVWANSLTKATAATLTVVDGKVNLTYSGKLDADKRQNDGSTPQLDFSVEGLPIPPQL